MTDSELQKLCGILLVVPELSNPQYDLKTKSVNFKTAIVANSTIPGPKEHGLPELWSQVTFNYKEMKNWCHKQGKKVDTIINCILYKFPAPLDFFSASKLFKNYELKEEVNNWIFENTCVSNEAWIAVQYSLPPRNPHYYKEILEDLCIARKYVTEYRKEAGHRIESIGNVTYHLDKAKGDSWLSYFSSYSCEHYKMDCQEKKIYSDSSNVACSDVQNQPNYEYHLDL